MTEAQDGRDGLSNHPVVTIKLASTSDELMQCYMLRAAVFMGEQHCPYWEEYDGNDYTASHIIVYVDGEPGGVACGCAGSRPSPSSSAPSSSSATARMGLFTPCSRAGRWSSAARRATPRPICTASAGCGRSSSAAASTRSTTRSSTSPTTSTAPSRATSRSTKRPGRPSFTDPMVLNRPEDRLDMPGILEQSMDRGASNPHADWTERRAN